MNLSSILSFADPTGLSQLRAVLSMLCGWHWLVRIFLAALWPAIAAPLSAPFWLLVFVPIYFTDNKMNKNQQGEKSVGKTFIASYGIFWAIMTVITFISLLFACSVNKRF